MNQSSARAASPFARPSSSLSISSPAAKLQVADEQTSEDKSSHSPALRASRQASVAPASDDDDDDDGPTPTSPTPHRPSTVKPSTSSQPPAAQPPPALFSQANLRPSAAARTTTSSSSATAMPSTSVPKGPTPSFPPLGTGGGSGAYTHLPPALLHSMRESFEVLDAANAGAVDAGAVAEMLAQLNVAGAGSARALAAFFPPHAPPQLNLARYLDVLAAPLAELSPPDELRAAFEAFDLDDSGQIDAAALRAALLRAGDEGGDYSSNGNNNNTKNNGTIGGVSALSESQIDAVLGEFRGRRAFGAGKGMAKGDVFRYRDFMASVSAGGAGSGAGDSQAVAA